MPYLTAAVVLVGVVAVLNLVLTLGVIRRLRLQDPAPVAGAAALRIGSRPAPFSASAVDGGPVTGADLVGRGPTLLGFFSPGCAPCLEQVPAFLDLAATWERDRVLVVIADDDAAADDLAGRFASVARTVVEGFDGPVTTAFGVRAFPTLGLLDDSGAVRAEANSVAGLSIAGTTVAA